MSLIVVVIIEELNDFATILLQKRKVPVKLGLFVAGALLNQSF